MRKLREGCWKAREGEGEETQKLAQENQQKKRKWIKISHLCLAGANRIDGSVLC